MQFRIGSVYRDKTSDVRFIAIQMHHDEAKNVMKFALVNVINWIVLEELVGKLLASGEISCATLVAENYEYAAKSLQEYYSGGHRKRPAKAAG